MTPPFVRNLLFAQIETLFKAVHASAGINQLLLAGVERMALVANLDVDLLLRGAGRERVAAGTGDHRFLVLRMDALFHLYSPLSGL